MKFPGTYTEARRTLDTLLDPHLEVDASRRSEIRDLLNYVDWFVVGQYGGHLDAVLSDRVDAARTRWL